MLTLCACAQKVKVRDAEEPIGMRQEWEEKYGITKLDLEGIHVCVCVCDDVAVILASRAVTSYDVPKTVSCIDSIGKGTT
jgi:hypothetical protein